MTVNEHISSFAGKPVVEWERGTPLSDASAKAWRIALSFDEADEGALWEEKFADFLKDPASTQVNTIVIGPWGEPWEPEAPNEVVEALILARPQLPNLRAIFLGDIICEECEISWIVQGDMSPLFTGYPELEHFAVRGASELKLGSPKLPELRSLVVQSGGLPASIVKELLQAELPKLEHLELWLGSEGYGAGTTVADLEPLLSGSIFPKLRYLGLKNSEISDEIAAAVADSPVLDRLEVLDLSMGTLGDKGVEALVASPGVKKLKKLDLHHHFACEDAVAKLAALGIEVDASDPQEISELNGEEWRYVEVSE